MAYFFKKHSELTGADLHIDNVKYGTTPPTYVVPDFIGQTYMDTVTQTAYVAYGTSVGEWVAGVDTILSNVTPQADTLSGSAGTATEASRDDHQHPFSVEVILRDGSVPFTNEQSMGGNKLTDVATPTVSGDAVNKEYVDSHVKTIDWQESVKDKDLTSPPVFPSVKDRYIVGVGATGAWTWLDNYIVEWNGSIWDQTIPDDGTATYVEDEGVIYIWNTISWIKISSTISHDVTTGAANSTVHVNYLRNDTDSSMNGNKIIDVATPTASGDVTNKDYVDTEISGLSHDGFSDTANSTAHTKYLRKDQDETTAYDLEITDATNGFILKSPDSHRWRITVKNNGKLETTDLGT